MFAIIKDNKIVRMLSAGVAFEYLDMQYSANWLNLSTPEEKAAIGVVDVVRAERPNDKYYWVGEAKPVFNAKESHVVVGYTTTPKDIDQAKADAISELKSMTFCNLASTDYVETRNMRDPTYKPDVIAWRNEVLAACRARVDAITACETIEALAALPAPELPSMNPAQPIV